MKKFKHNKTPDDASEVLFCGNSRLAYSIIKLLMIVAL